MNRTLVTVFSACLLLATVTHVPAHSQNINKRFQLTPYLDLKGYSWKEFSEQGAEDLTEDGALFSIGVIPRVGFTKDRRFFADGDFQLYFGSVGYKGFIQDNQGNRTPFDTDVGYFGLDFGLSSGYNFALSRSVDLAPFGGFGLEHWSRDIGQGKVRQGYVEKYTTFLFNIGSRVAYSTSQDVQFFASLALKMPLTISESVDLSTTGAGPSDISLSPGLNPQFILRAGGSFYSTFAEFYFIGWTLSRSSEDRGFLQPESKRQNVGLRAGYTFGFD